MPSTATAGLSAQELLDRRRAQNKLAQRRFREKARLSRRTQEASADSVVTVRHAKLQPTQTTFAFSQEQAPSAPSPNTAAFLANPEQSLLFPQPSMQPAAPTSLPTSYTSDANLLLQDWGSLVSDRVRMEQLSSSSSSASTSLPVTSTSSSVSSSIEAPYLSSFPTNSEIRSIFSPSELDIIASQGYASHGSSSSDGISQSSSSPPTVPFSNLLDAQASPPDLQPDNALDTAQPVSISNFMQVRSDDGRDDATVARPRSISNLYTTPIDGEATATAVGQEPHWYSSRTSRSFDPAVEASYIDRIGAIIGSNQTLGHAFEQFVQAQSKPIRASSYHATILGSDSSGWSPASSSASSDASAPPNQNMSLAQPTSPRAILDVNEALQAHLRHRALHNVFSTSNFAMPRRGFCEAMTENALRMGFRLEYLCNPYNISYIAESWDLWKCERQNAITQQNKRFVEIDEMLQEAKAQGPVKTLDCTGGAQDVTLNKRLRWENIPDNMLPTKEQLLFSHHPYVDVALPWPSVRARFLDLRSKSQLSQDEFVADIIWRSFVLKKDHLFQVWGDDAMDPEAWEISEEVFTKWWGLFDASIIQRTNWWRRQRGLKNLEPVPDETSDNAFVRKGLGTGRNWPNPACKRQFKEKMSNVCRQGIQQI